MPAAGDQPPPPAPVEPPAEGTARFQYCAGCGEQVVVYAVPTEAGAELRCSYCGLTLRLPSPRPAAPMGCVLLADDEKFFRSLLSELLVEQRLAETVVPCVSGAELLTKLSERLRARQDTHLVILDIVMQDLDGIVTARAIRAVEHGFGVARPVPILFLSGVRPDTALRTFVARMQPALFLNKAVDATPERLAMRLRKMADYFAGGRPEAAGGTPRPGGAA